MIQKKCAGYLGSQHFPDIPSGSCREGVRCENLEKMSFDDGEFDLVITQDVFEHVLQPDKAFSEINRTLKDGGTHLFTVPVYHGQKTVIRATTTTDVYSTLRNRFTIAILSIVPDHLLLATGEMILQISLFLTVAWIR